MPRGKVQVAAEFGCTAIALSINKKVPEAEKKNNLKNKW